MNPTSNITLVLKVTSLKVLFRSELSSIQAADCCQEDYYSRWESELNYF